MEQHAILIWRRFVVIIQSCGSVADTLLGWHLFWTINVVLSSIGSSLFHIHHSPLTQYDSCDCWQIFLWTLPVCLLVLAIAVVRSLVLLRCRPSSSMRPDTLALRKQRSTAQLATEVRVGNAGVAALLGPPVRWSPRKASCPCSLGSLGSCDGGMIWSH